MKKLLALLMTLALMLTPALSLAQGDETPLCTYAQSEGLYSFQYPETWTLLDRATIDATLDMVRQYSDEKLAQALESYRTILSQMDIAMLLSADQLCNVVISFNDIGTVLSYDQLLTLAPSMIAQYKASFSNFAATNEGSRLDIGENAYLLLEYSADNGVGMMQGAACYIAPTNNLFSIVITAPGDQMDTYLKDFMTMLQTMEFAK